MIIIDPNADIVPLILSPDEIEVMDQETALAYLIVFSMLNGITADQEQDGFELLRLAAAQPDIEVTFEMGAAWLHTDDVHYLVDAIARDATATAVAAIAMGAPRGTTWTCRTARDLSTLYATAISAPGAA